MLTSFQYTVFNSINSWVRDVPIVVAEFRRSGMPFKFTVGDGKVYGGFENGPLLPSSFYEFFIREIHVETANSKVCTFSWKHLINHLLEEVIVLSS